MSEPDPVRLRLQPGRDKSLRQHHPWVFSGAVAGMEGEPAPGAIADAVDASGEFIARGFVNPRSQIVFRALTFRKEAIDAAFLERRIRAALELRQRFVDTDTDAYRIVHGEGDLLPGLVVDRYAGWLVVQFGAAGMEAMRPLVLEALATIVSPRGIWERSEGPSRREEGLPETNALAAGEAPPEHVVIHEQGLGFAVDLRHGHKTGFYLDQRPARALVRRLARGLRVLDVLRLFRGLLGCGRGRRRRRGDGARFLRLEPRAAAAPPRRQRPAGRRGPDRPGRRVPEDRARRAVASTSSSSTRRRSRGARPRSRAPAAATRT